MIKNQLLLIDLYDRNIEEVRLKLEFVNEKKWHSELYETVFNFIRGHLSPLQARQQVTQQTSDMNLQILNEINV